jgi:hypothetical protein
MEKYLDACHYFKQALTVNSEHKVALKYLDAAENKLKELNEERQRLERGEFLMVKWIDIHENSRWTRLPLRAG